MGHMGHGSKARAEERDLSQGGSMTRPTTNPVTLGYLVASLATVTNVVEMLEKSMLYAANAYKTVSYGLMQCTGENLTGTRRAVSDTKEQSAMPVKGRRFDLDSMEGSRDSIHNGR